MVLFVMLILGHPEAEYISRETSSIKRFKQLLLQMYLQPVQFI